MVLIVNVAVVLPAAMETDAGTVVPARVEASLMGKPPEGAKLEIVIVPTDEAPPKTVAGLNVRLDRTGALMVMVAVAVTPLSVAAMTAAVWEPTAGVFTANVPEVWPTLMVTLAVTVTDLTVLVSLTVKPALGAGPVRVMVPVLVAPPTTDDGFRDIAPRPIGATLTVADWEMLPSVPVTFAV